jgi:hypothetical protein
MTNRPDPHAVAAGRRARIHTLRRRVAAIGVVAFLALWGVLYVQLATGHDPGLSDASPVAVVQSADPAAGTTADTTDAAAAASDDGAVTTSQS